MAKYTLKHKSKFYGMKEGWVFGDNYNEKLDNAVAIVRTKEDMAIAPFDLVRIYKDDIKFKSLLVDNYVREVVEFKPQKKFRYTINLMSLIKYLERITLPSLSITKPINGKRRSVYYYIKIYFESYMPKRKIQYSSDPNLWQYEYIIKLGSELKTRFDSIPCPDFSWNNPTLKEVLDDLMMVDDCICVVNDDTLSYLDLSKKGSVIDDSKLYNETETMSATDYMSDLDITMKNAIGENKVIAKEYASARSEGGTLTTDNMAIFTQFPIYNIKSVKACFMLKYINTETTQNDYAYVELEIAPLIKEEEEFNVLDPTNPFDAPAYDFATASKYKAYCLHYKRGDNKIQNLGSGSFFYKTLDRVLAIAWREDKEIYNLYASDNLRPQRQLTDDNRTISFIVEYETLADHKMKVGKYLPNIKLPNAIFDGQSESYVDIKNQASFEYSKVNRFSNRIHTIEGKYYNEDDLPKLADTYNGEILFSREIIYHDDYILFKGHLTKNYILKDYFTGVMSKRRSWAIAKNNEALTRYDITKLYVEFSYDKKVDKLEDLLRYESNDGLLQALLSNFDSDGYQTIDNAVITTTKNFVKYPLNGYGYLLDFNIESQGMSLCFNFGFNDNYSVGNYVFMDDKNYRNGIYKYTDDYGEIDSMNIKFYKYIDMGDGEFEYPMNLQKYPTIEEASDMDEKLTNVAKRKPLLNLPPKERYILIDLNIPKWYKDSREILKHTLQFEFCSDTDEIIITPEFVKRIYLANQEIGNFRIFTGTALLDYDRYHVGDTKPLGIEDTEGNYGFAVNYNFDKKEFSASITLETYFDRPRGWRIHTWGLADKNGKLLIGVNVRDNGTILRPDPNLTIHANLLKYRDDNLYNEDGDIVAKMYD